MIWLTLLGCAALWDVGNRAPVRRYAEDLVQISAVPMTVDTCHMFPSSRKAYCLLSGDDADIQSFLQSVGAKSITPVEKPHGDDNCTALADFEKQWTPSGKLPGNSNNVHARTIWTRPGGVCFEFEYPYG